MTDTIKATLFKHGGLEFVELLSEHEIPLQMQRYDPGTVVASGEVIEIITAVGGVSLISSIAAVIVRWLKNKASRKIMIQTDDNRVVNLEGCDIDIEKLQKLLEMTRSISIIQTKPDDDADL